MYEFFLFCLGGGEGENGECSAPKFSNRTIKKVSFLAIVVLAIGLLDPFKKNQRKPLDLLENFRRFYLGPFFSSKEMFQFFYWYLELS